MKPSGVLFVIAFTLLCTIARAQASTMVDGHWEGGVSRNGSVQPIYFDFTSNVSGDVIGDYSIPELGLYEQPMKNVILNGSVLTVRFLYGTFALDVHEDVADMTGINRDWNPPIDLHLKRMGVVQTYREESYRVRCGSVMIAGTLYRPISAGNVPLVIIIPGSDNSGRTSWEYRGYGPMLAQRGVAAFVYDKRNVGSSSKVNAKPTFRDYALDASGLVDGLRHAQGVDSLRVGLAGASQGGWIAPMAAALNKNVAFIILLSGPSVSVEQQELDRVAAAMRERGASVDDQEVARKITQAYFDVGDGRVPISALQAQVDWVEQNKPKWADVLSGPDPGESLADAADDWERINYDPAPTLRNTKIPILAFFGTSDDEVLSSDNLPLLNALVGRNNPNNRVVVIDGANHGLFMGQRLSGTQWNWPQQYWIWDRRAPNLVPQIVSWIASLARVQGESILKNGAESRRR